MKREIWLSILLGIFGGVATAANPELKPGVEAHRSDPFKGIDSMKSGMGAGIWSVRVTGTGQDNPCWTSGAAFPEPKIQNPWTDPMGYVSGYSNPAGFVGYWGNGDGRFLYPPNRDVTNDKSKYLSGPVSSIRWEMLREGLEDYEYFWLLREAITKAEKAGMTKDKLDAARTLLDIGPEIVVDKTHFTQNPQNLYQQRTAIAEMIESLR